MPNTHVLLLPCEIEPHHHIIKGQLSTLSSLNPGTMPDTCHFCYAQELLSVQSWNAARISFSMEAGWPEENSLVSFLSGPTGWCVEVMCFVYCNVAIGHGKKILEVHIRLLLMSRETPSNAYLAFPGVGRTVTFCCFNQGLPMISYFHCQRMTCGCQCVCL